MYWVTEEEKLRAVPVMLSGNALNNYAKNLKGCTSYNESMDTMKKWYNSDDKRSCILKKWKTMALTKATAEYPTESGVTYSGNLWQN